MSTDQPRGRHTPPACPKCDDQSGVLTLSTGAFVCESCGIGFDPEDVATDGGDDDPNTQAPAARTDGATAPVVASYEYVAVGDAANDAADALAMFTAAADTDAVADERDADAETDPDAERSVLPNAQDVTLTVRNDGDERAIGIESVEVECENTLEPATRDRPRERASLSGPVLAPEVERNVVRDGDVWVRAHAENKAADKPTATARSVPTVNGVQYGRDDCPDCGDPWEAYSAHTGDDGLTHVLFCECGRTERETQYFAGSQPLDAAAFLGDEPDVATGDYGQE